MVERSIELQSPDAPPFVDLGKKTVTEETVFA